MSYVIGVRREIAMCAERAFQAFSRKEQLEQWFTSEAFIDLRVGGRFSNVDGDQGEFLEIVPNKVLHFTWETGCTGPVRVNFTERAQDRVSVHIEQRLEDLAHKKIMYSAWSWALDNLKSFLETGKPISYGDWVGDPPPQ